MGHVTADLQVVPGCLIPDLAPDYCCFQNSDQPSRSGTVLQLETVIGRCCSSTSTEGKRSSQTPLRKGTSEGTVTVVGVVIHATNVDLLQVPAYMCQTPH